jgi:multicomponent Na+:H+ antiporter subunit A
MLIALLALLALTGPLLWLLRPHRWRHAGWLAAIPPALVTAWLLTQLGPVGNGAILTEQYVWSEVFGLALDLRLDGLGLFFGLIIAGIGAAIAIYTGYYFEEDPRLGYFYALLYLFMASMMGLVWTDNLLALFVFWEGTSITSYLLISFKLTDKDALEGARRALVVTSLGALGMLGGLVLLGQMGGTYTISQILAQPSTTLLGHPLFVPMLLLILLGAFTKSAQFPFHFWLPGAMAAPTPASAYLHSATMVKAGVYLLARLHPAFAESQLWFWALFLVGGITMLLGAASALRYYDLKAILAHATVSQLGVLVMLLAFNIETAAVAVVLGILAHALYKGPLFLVAGIIDHATGTRDIRRLAGLAQSMPLVGAAAFLAGLSMAGLMPTFGFIAKETLLESFYGFIGAGEIIVGWVGLVASTVGGALFMAYSLTLIWEPFLRRTAPLEQAHIHHRPAVLFVLPVLVLTLIGALIPFLLSVVEHELFAPPAAAIIGAPVKVHLLLWHGLTPVFLTSVLAIGLGLLIFLVRERVRALFTLAPAWLNGAYLFDRATYALYALAGWSTRTVQGTSFPTQISVTLLAAVAFLLFAVLTSNFIADLQTDWTATPTLYEVVLAALAVVAALVTVLTRSRLSAIISLGMVGVVVTLIFVFFSAPDLALTQLLIEVLTLVLLVLVFYRIPVRASTQTRGRRSPHHSIIAVLVGLWGFGMVLLAAETPFMPPISDFFLRNAVPSAHGGNVVNVILVDFRAIDTWGEITVLVVAAVGGYALLRASRLRPLSRPDQTTEPAAVDGATEQTPPPAAVTAPPPIPAAVTEERPHA